MIQVCLVDESLNRLMKHFGSRVVVRPPAAAADLAKLEAATGPLPRSLTIFLSTCNGLCIGLAQGQPPSELHHIHQILAELSDPGAPPIPPGVIPVRGDRDGERDWVIVEPGLAHGVVVRWDPWSGGAELTASSFDHYVDAWSRYLVKAFDPSGRPRPAGRGARRGERSAHFDWHWVVEFDPKLLSLRRDPEIIAWAKDLNLLVGTGDDFE